MLNLILETILSREFPGSIFNVFLSCSSYVSKVFKYCIFIKISARLEKPWKEKPSSNLCPTNINNYKLHKSK